MDFRVFFSGRLQQRHPYVLSAVYIVDYFRRKWYDFIVRRLWRSDRQMKKRIILCLFCLLFASGCGKDTPAAEEAEMDLTSAEESLEEHPAFAAADSPEEFEPDSGDSEASYPRELSAKELQEFTIWINGNDHYGFLLSEYDKPEDVDLEQVFYNGAGFASESLSEEERAAFLKETGQEEICGDTVRLTTEQIQNFLIRKTGVSYENITHPLSWVYLKTYDIYISEHGDTNYMNFTCVSGRQTGINIWELDCVPGNGDETYVPPCRLTIQKQNGEYQFVSNHYADDLIYSMDIWKIEEQCFDVDLEGWGDVTFSSYAPDPSVQETGDAVFCLEKNGEELFRFPDVMEGNRRPMQRFVQVLAVSFPDYSEDGNKDVMIISEYQPLPERENQNRVTEVRLYRNRPDTNEFILDMDRMDTLNANRWNHSIQEVMDHMGEADRKILLDYLTDHEEVGM